jgi:hypothetical protein
MPVPFKDGELDSIRKKEDEMSVLPKPRLQTFLLLNLGCEMPYTLVKLIKHITRHIEYMNFIHPNSHPIVHRRLATALGLPNEDPFDLIDLRTTILLNCY